MKLMLGRAHSLLVALTAVDRDEKCRLDGRTRIAIAIDITLLQPHVAAYEKVRARKLRDIAGEALDPFKEAVFAAADAELRESEVEIDLKPFSIADLKLDDNPRITGAMIAMLAPVLSDLSA